VSARPDFAAFLVMTFGLWLVASALEREKLPPLLLFAGAAVIAAAFFLKQTAAAGAFVPLVALALQPALWSGKRLLAAAVPSIIVAAVIGALNLFAPIISAYMIRGVGSYTIQTARLPEAAYALASAVPAFFAAAAIAAIAGARLRGTPERWLAAAAVIFVPVSLMSRLKVGGDVNSYYPALACLLALALRLGASAAATLAPARRSRLAALVFGGSAALLLLRSTLGDLGAATRYAGYRHGDGRYAEAVRTIASLEGKVAAPDDPTLLIGAGRAPGRCAMFEEEMNVQHGFYGTLPPPRVMEEIAVVDFVMRTKGSFVELLSAAALAQAGFAQVDVPALRGSAYELWQRKGDAR
jgi:hypothetical protein